MKFTRLSGAAALAILISFGATAQAQVYFDGGTGVWDNTTPNWTAGTATWPANGAAVFSGGGSTVTIGDNLQVGTITFAPAAGSYFFDNSGGWTIDVNGAGISTATAAPQTISNIGIINFNAGASAGTATINIDSVGDVNFNGALSTAGSSTLINAGNLSFNAGSSAGSSSISNIGNVLFNGSAVGGTAAVSNGGFVDISTASGTITLGSLTNSVVLPGPTQLNGAVTLGLKTLQLAGGLSLATAPGSGQNLLSFDLTAPGSSGTINVGGLFTGSDSGRTDISLTAVGSPAQGTYVLIDWSTGSATGVDLSDFALVGGLPAGLSPSTHLEILGGNQLVLVAVPEPATFAMPLAAILGMVLLRRKFARRLA